MQMLTNAFSPKDNTLALSFSDLPRNFPDRIACDKVLFMSLAAQLLYLLNDYYVVSLSFVLCRIAF